MLVVSACTPVSVSNKAEDRSLSNCDIAAMQLGEARYHCVQEHDRITVRAEGENPSPGYRNCLLRSNAPKGVVEIKFFWGLADPAAAEPQVLTPFAIQKPFLAEGTVESIIIHDRSGPHIVTVEHP